MAKRVRPASHWQHPNSVVRRIAIKAVPALARDLREAFDHLGELLPSQAVDLVRTGRIDDLKHHMRWGHYREVLKGVFARMINVRQDAADAGVKEINAAFEHAGRVIRFRKLIDDVAKAIGDRFNFDMLDADTQERVRQAQDALIRQLEVSARDAIDGIVTAGVKAGLSPADIVDDIREMVGLTDTQVQAVFNYRSMLEDLDPNALRRQLRNAAHDVDIQDAIDAGDVLDADVIDAFVADYVSNYLDYRAATIAQTESVRASNAGLQDAYQQAIDRGALPADAVRRSWKISLDEKTCPVCLSIPDRNPDGRALDEPFDSIDGQFDQPPEPHPNCRCGLEFVTDLNKVPDTDAAFS